MTILKFAEWSLKDRVNENKGPHNFSCAMVYYDMPEMKKLHEEIEQDDIYIDENDLSFGLENDPHVTLLYGLHDEEVDPEEVKRICTEREYSPIKLHNISAFKNDKYEVLKFDADSEVLHNVNKDLSSLPYTTDYPDYHPHSTIGYLKPGKSDKYIQKFKDQEYTVNPSHIVYSRANGEKLKYSL